MEYGVWLPIDQAPKDGDKDHHGTPIICCWAGTTHWCKLVWKYNRRIDRFYFGDPYEDDDYDLCEEGGLPKYEQSGQPTHFLAVPPIPAKTDQLTSITR